MSTLIKSRIFKEKNMSNNLLFITLVAITLFHISAYTFIMVRFTDTQNQIKVLADKQFDAEEVMRLYQMKYNAPRIRCGQPNVIELKASYSLPYEYRNEVSEEEIYLQLTKDLTKDLGKYVDVVVDKDIERMSTEYRARLRVVVK